MITNKSDSHKWLQMKVIVTNDYKFSSNVNEVIITVLNSLFIYLFLQKDFTRKKKAQTAYSEQKQKSVNKKHLKKKSYLFA